jgi:hypothetical protein
MRAIASVLAAAAVTLVAATVVVAAPADPFTGAWTATDPDDGSPLKTQISAPDAAGRRHVVLIDQFASACDAPATAIGFGTVSGTTLTASVDVRCGRAILDSDAPFTWELVGDTLVGDGVIYTRPG